MNRVIRHSPVLGKQVVEASFRFYPDAVDFFEVMKRRQPNAALELIPAIDTDGKRLFHNCGQEVR